MGGELTWSDVPAVICRRCAVWGLVCLRLRVGDGIAWVSDAIALAGIDRRGGWFGLIFLLSGIARCGDFLAITGEKITILYFWWWGGGGRSSRGSGGSRPDGHFHFAVPEFLSYRTRFSSVRLFGFWYFIGNFLVWVH